MPELPEVERSRRALIEALAGQTLVHVEALDDAIVFDGVTAKEVCASLRGARVNTASRWGKHLWLELDRRPWPLFHLGMTGAFEVAGRASLSLKTGPTPTSQWPPRFAKLVLSTDTGRRVAFTNARRFGRIRLRDDPRTEPPIVELGLDPLVERPTAASLGPKLAKRRGTLKGLLLDQRFAAGVGNWVADEVLHAASLAPRRTPASLKPSEIEALAHALVAVIEIAVGVDAESSKFPASWLFHLRWRPEAHPITTAGEAVVVEKVAGRTTVWVPSRQR